MPFSPFHFGIALLIQSILLFLDPFSLFIGSVILDIEGITAWFILPNSFVQLHGPLHSFTLAIIVGSISGLLINLIYTLLIDYYKIENLPKFTKRVSIGSSLFGTISHVILDAFLYEEMDLFYPIEGNMLFGMFSSSEVYLFCILAGIFGLLVLCFRLILKTRNKL